MKKVYIVTGGDYSDYHIVAVSSTEEKAKEYIQTTGKGDDYVEFEVDVPYERKDRVWRIDMRVCDHEVTYCEVERSYDNVEDCIDCGGGSEVCAEMPCLYGLKPTPRSELSR